MMELCLGQLPDGRFCLCTDLRPGEAPDGSCAYRVVAASLDFEAVMAAARLLQLPVISPQEAADALAYYSQPQVRLSAEERQELEAQEADTGPGDGL